MCCIIIAAASSRLPPRGRNCLLRELPSFFHFYCLAGVFKSTAAEPSEELNLAHHRHRMHERTWRMRTDGSSFLHCKQREVKVIWVKRTAMASWRWLRNDLHSCDVRLWARLHVVRCLFQRRVFFFTFFLLVSRIASLSLPPSSDVRSEKCISMKNLSLLSLLGRQAQFASLLWFVVCCFFLVFCTIKRVDKKWFVRFPVF